MHRKIKSTNNLEHFEKDVQKKLGERDGENSLTGFQKGMWGLSRKAARPGEKRAWRSDHDMGRKGKPFIK